MGQVILEIVLPPVMATAVGCGACREFMEEAGLPTELGGDDYPAELRELWGRLSQWIREIQESHGGRIKVEVIDGLSPMGLWKQLRHGIRRLPGFVVQRRHAISGFEPQKVEALLEEILGEREAS